MLTETAIKAAKPSSSPRKLADEKGLYLLLSPSGSKLWRLKYRIAGREKLLAIGSYPEISLRAARDLRDAARKQIAEGTDPSAEKKAARLAVADTFAGVAAEWLALNRKSYHKKTISKAEWLLDDWLNKYIGRMPIRSITHCRSSPCVARSNRVGITNPQIARAVSPAGYFGMRSPPGTQIGIRLPTCVARWRRSR